jgi:4-diphosphocytidyl-2-C-methyl-D-erythritol kinase
MRSVTLVSPAKINLCLEVWGRRPDGYHEITTLMQVVDLADTLHVERRQAGIGLTAEGVPVPAGEDNLAVRAAARFFAAAPPGGAHIHLTKRIPAGGGLGGGSSNAAAVLWGLNLLYGRPLPADALAGLAASLGSDVPFFLSSGFAWAEGRGERIRPAGPAPQRWAVVVDPGFGISTAWAYGQLTLPLTPGDRMPNIMASVARGDASRALELAFNRLEDAVLPHFPRLAELKAVLIEAGASPALLSGTGSCLFGLTESWEGADRVAARVAAVGARPIVCRTLAGNPILDAEAACDPAPERDPGGRAGRPGTPPA